MNTTESQPAPPRPRGRPKTDKARGIQSAASGVEVLKVMMDAGRSMHLREIAAGVGRDTSSVYRYLVSFAASGLVKQDDDGRYDLGPMAVQLGLVALRRLDGLSLAIEQLAKLIETVDADGHVTVWGTYGPTVVRALARPSDMVVRVQEGWVMPVTTSTTGRTWACHLSAAELEPALQRETVSPGRRKTRRADLASNLEAAKQAIASQGFSFASGELRVGVDVLCAPIFNRHGAMVYAITLVSESPHLTPSENPDAAAQLLAATRYVSASLGAPPERLR